MELTHLRLEKASEGSITPDHGVGDLKAIYDGKGKQAEEEREHLSKIVETCSTSGLDWSLALPTSSSSTSSRRRGSASAEAVEARAIVERLEPLFRHLGLIDWGMRLPDEA